MRHYPLRPQLRQPRSNSLTRGCGSRGNRFNRHSRSDRPGRRPRSALTAFARERSSASNKLRDALRNRSGTRLPRSLRCSPSCCRRTSRAVDQYQLRPGARSAHCWQPRHHRRPRLWLQHRPGCSPCCSRRSRRCGSGSPPSDEATRRDLSGFSGSDFGRSPLSLSAGFGRDRAGPATSSLHDRR